VTIVCPGGHHSATTDYCDQCGLPIGGAGTPVPGPVTENLPVVEEEADTSAAAVHEPCPGCGAQRSGDDRFCEGCGHDFLAPPRKPVAWEAVARADRDQFERLGGTALSFPGDHVERRFTLQGSQVRIGRSRGRADEPAPEIDLAGTPEDPGLSRPQTEVEPVMREVRPGHWVAWHLY